MNRITKDKNGGRYLMRLLTTLVLCPIIILWAAIIVLYIPPVQEYAIKKICKTVNDSGDFNLSIGAFHLAFPLKFTISDFTFAQKDSVIAEGKRIAVNIRPAALLKGEIEVNYISLEHTRLNSHSLIKGMNIEGNIGHFRVTARNINPTEERADIRLLHIADTKIDIKQWNTHEEKKDSTSTPVNWIIELQRGNIINAAVNFEQPQDSVRIASGIDKLMIIKAVVDLGKSAYSLENILLHDSHIAYDRGNSTPDISPMDHIHIEDIELETGEIGYTTRDIAANIKNLAFAQKRGMILEKFSTQLSADSSTIDLRNLIISTKNGTKAYATATIPRQTPEGKNSGDINGKIAIHVDKRDLSGFLTETEYNALDILPDSMLNANMHLHGNLEKIYIDTLYANIPELADLEINGTTNNINNLDDITANLDINGKISDLARITQMQRQPDSIAKQQVTISGNAYVLQKEYSLNLQMQTKKGYATLKTTYDIGKNSYNAKALIEKIGLYDIIPSVPLHELSMQIEAEGMGTDIFDSLTHYNVIATIDTLRYDNIFLQDITLDARQADRQSKIEIKSQSPNLQMRFTADTKIDSPTITNSSHIAVKSADLQNFGIVEAPLTAALNLDIKASTDMQQTHGVKITGDNFELITQKQTFTPARLEFNGYTSPDTSFVNMNTGDLKIAGTLTAGYKRLQSALDKISAMYLKARTSEKTMYYAHDIEKELPALSLNVECGQKNILANFMRFNKIEFSDFNIHLAIDSIKGINGNCGLHNLKKEEIQIDTIRFFIRQNENTIRYFAGIRTRSLDPEQEKLKFYSALYGSLHNDSLVTNFVFRDNKDNVGARIGLHTLLMPEGLDFHFNPKATLFNRPFSFNEDNYFTLRKNLAISSNIELKDTLNSGLRIYTVNDSTMLRDISAELFNIDLNTVTRIIPYAPDIAGILNADIHLRQNKESTMMSADVRSNGLMYEGTLLGDETFEVAYLPKNNNTHYIDVSIHHNDNIVFNLNGDYTDIGEQPLINGEATMTHFPLKLSDAFLKESRLALDGYIDGKLSVNGATDNIKADGYVHFDSVYADAPMFGTKLHLDDDNVKIVDNRLTFDNFNIYAKGNTPFQINGDIDLAKPLNPEFNLRMRAKDYEIVNAKQEKGNMLYGRLFIDFSSFVRGYLNSLKAFGQATILGKSDITYVMLDSPLATESELDGLVQFVNFADSTQVTKAEEEDIDFGNLSMNMTLNIEEGARINADFDENRNSYIELQGGGNLHLTYTSETGTSLTGRYTLNNGQLKYTLPIIPLKTFNISEGSYINWNGDIMNPTLNITALERMTSSVTMENGTAQAVAFDVGVVLTNTLDDMGLSFTLSAPENAAVQDELNSIDKETLNKYAVTMLITGAYLGSNGGITVSSALSSFLDAKINDIAGNAMKSVDINVGITDVENAETGGTYKNYSFSFAKRFWNDRLTVIIGGEVNSGDTSGTQNESFINNVSLEWKVSETGNRYIRLFYDKNYESILEGEIIETGIGYVYKRKLDNLKELFMFRKKDDSETLILRPNRKTENTPSHHEEL